MIRACFKYLLDPRGRFSRSDMLSIAIGMVIFEVIAAQFPANSEILVKFLYAMVIWIGIAATMKRLHDTGHSGWWLLGGAAFLCMWTAVIAIGGLFILGREVLSPGSSGHFMTLGLVMLPAIAMTLWLHVAKGVAYKNQYGPPTISASNDSEISDAQSEAASNNNVGIPAT
jgi:uncharacterized membrane protein YhaH (DUF805 family)